jgi:hypothetical protein
MKIALGPMDEAPGVFQIGPGAVRFYRCLHIVVADVPVVHHPAIDVATFGLDESRLDEVLSESGNHARMLAAGGPLGRG